VKLQVQLRQSKLIFERKTTNKIEPEKCQKKGQEKRKKEHRYRRVLQSQQSMIAGSVMIYQSQLIFVAQSCFIWTNCLPYCNKEFLRKLFFFELLKP
jgi:hypothetical protein